MGGAAGAEQDDGGEEKGEPPERIHGVAAAATRQEKILEERERGSGRLVAACPTGDRSRVSESSVGATPTWRRASLRSRVGGCELPSLCHLGFCGYAGCRYLLLSC
jgi:hypothetical protein